MNKLYNFSLMSKSWRVVALLCLFVIPPSLELSAQPYSNPTVCGLNLALPDNNDPGFDSIPLTVTTSVGTTLGTDVQVSDVNIIIDHTWQSDVVLNLLSPNGVTVPLWANIGSSANDFGDTTGGCTSALNLNMAAASSVNTASGSPITGSFVPLGDFASFNDGSNPNGQWTLLYQDQFGGDVGTLQYAEITFSAPPTCPKPVSLNTVNIGTTTATGVWTSAGPQTSYQVELGAAGFAQGSGTIVSVTDTFVNATGLNPGAFYDWYVREICAAGDTSMWEGPASFQTNCVTYTEPYFTDFDSSSTLDPCWSVIDATTTSFSFVQISSFLSVSAPNSVEIYNGSATSGDLMLISPEFSDFNAGKEINFDARVEDASLSSLIVGTITDPANAATFTPFDTIQFTTDDTWFSFTVQFTGYTGSDNHIAFAHSFESSFDDIHVDNFFYRQIPTCPDPSDLNTINIGTTTATGVWQSNAPGTNFQVELGPAGFALGTGTLLSVATDTFVNVTGLTNGTAYDWYVREICGPGDTSIWLGPESFTTNCNAPSPVTLPIMEGFETINGTTVGGGLVYCTPTATYTHISSLNSGRARFGTDAPVSPASGSGALTFDEAPGLDNDPINWLDMTWDMTAYASNTDLELLFDHNDHGDEADAEDKVSIRGSDTSAWITVADIEGGPSNQWQSVGPLDIDSIIAANNQQITSSFQVRLGQHDNTAYPADGRSFDNIVIRQTPTCFAPVGLNTINITATTATGVWSNNMGPNVSYQIEIGAAGFALGTGTSAVLTDTFVNVSGLTSNTCYDWYIREICAPGDTSFWAGPETFCTPCSPVSGTTLPFFEGWENYGNGTIQGSNNVVCNTDYSWALTTSDPSGRLRWGSDAVQASTGTGAVTLDRDPSGGTQINYLDLNLDLSAQANNDLELYFDFSHHGEESHLNDRVWLRGSDTSAWIEVYDLNANQGANGTFVNVGPIDVDAAISTAGQVITSTFQVRFGQEDNFPATSTTASDGYTFDNILVDLAPYDVPCSAIQLTVGAPPASYDNTGATIDVGEPKGSCWTDSAGFTAGILHNTVWFSFVATKTAPFIVSTNFPPTPNDDTQIAAYLAANGCGDYSAYSEIGCGEDINATNWLSEMTTDTVTIGDTVYVQVDGWSGTVGSFDIQVTEVPVPNDEPCTASELTVGAAPASFTNEGTGIDVGEPKGTCWTDSAGFTAGILHNTAWLYFVAPAAGEYFVTTNFPGTPNDDTQIAAYLAANGCGDYSAYTEIGCGEDINATNWLSEMTTSLVAAGDTVYVQVDGWSGTVGSFDIQVTQVVPVFAGFTYTSNAQTLTFTDTSTGNPTAWDWDFGDGQTATTQNPSNTYASVGAYTVTLIASNANTSDTAVQTVQVVNGLNNALNQFFNIYPNPAKDRLVIESNTKSIQGFEIIDIMGRTIITSEEVITGTKEVNVSEMIPGNYMLKLNFGEEAAIHRFMIQR